MSKLPGLVVLKGRRPPARRHGRSTRSMVAALILQRLSATSRRCERLYFEFTMHPHRMDQLTHKG
ncbi:MAG: hypothetical protein AAB303_02650, partial [Chloroflexota bacterium]